MKLPNCLPPDVLRDGFEFSDSRDENPAPRQRHLRTDDRPTYNARQRHNKKRIDRLKKRHGITQLAHGGRPQLSLPIHKTDRLDCGTC